MFTARVKTTYDHDKRQLADEMEKHRAAAEKRLGDKVEMLNSKTTSMPRDSGGHDVVLETEWGIAKPYVPPKPPKSQAEQAGQAYVAPKSDSA